MSKAKGILDIIESNDKNYIEKSIYSDFRTGRLTLGFSYTKDGDENEYIEDVTWKQFKESKLPDTSSERLQTEFAWSLVKQLKQFNKQVDYNGWVKKGNPSFEEKVDKLLSMGTKYTKSGLKNYYVAT